jgi:hypothetical protein
VPRRLESESDGRGTASADFKFAAESADSGAPASRRRGTTFQVEYDSDLSGPPRPKLDAVDSDSESVMTTNLNGHGDTALAACLRLEACPSKAPDRCILPLSMSASAQTLLPQSRLHRDAAAARRAGPPSQPLAGSSTGPGRAPPGRYAGEPGPCST